MLCFQADLTQIYHAGEQLQKFGEGNETFLKPLPKLNVEEILHQMNKINSVENQTHSGDTMTGEPSYTVLSPLEQNRGLSSVVEHLIPAPRKTRKSGVQVAQASVLGLKGFLPFERTQIFVIQPPKYVPVEERDMASHF